MTPAKSSGEFILVAVAWPYASGPRHIGHVAGFGVPSDIFARYPTVWKGNKVLMVSGTDEHGTPIMVAADREGITPAELAERFNEVIRADLRDLGLSYDLFTTDHDAQPLSRDPGPVQDAPREGPHRPRDHARRLLGLDRTHAPGSVHRGDVP